MDEREERMSQGETDDLFDGAEGEAMRQTVFDFLASLEKSVVERFGDDQQIWPMLQGAGVVFVHEAIDRDLLLGILGDPRRFERAVGVGLVGLRDPE